MEHNEHYELILNHISAAEMVYKGQRRYEDYINTVCFWLSHNRKFTFADEILKRYSSGKDITAILEQYKHQFIPGAIVERDKKREQAYYDLYCDEIIEPGDTAFNYFFSCKLNQIDILDMDKFLQYHLETSFGGEQSSYTRFLSLCLRKYEQIIKPTTIETVKEWIKMVETVETNNDTIRKAKVKREVGDNITSLNLAQTAYLVNLLKEGKIIIKDDVILTSKRAGEAFSLLTGYSADTIRLKMNLKGQFDLTYQDRKMVREQLYHLIALIDKAIAESKGKKG